MVHREDEDPVAVALERLAGTHLDELERVGDPAEHAAEVVEQLAQPRRPVDGERHLPSAERERLQNPGQAERSGRRGSA